VKRFSILLLRTRRLLAASLGGSTMVVLFFALSAWQVPAQTASRTFHRSAGNIRDPVRLVQLGWNGIPAKNVATFDDGPDWVKHLSVLLVNNSAKTLTCVEIQGDFPELADPADPHGPRVIATIRTGRLPEHALYGDSGQKLPFIQYEPIAVGPQEKFEVKFGDHADQIGRSLGSHGSGASLTQARVWVMRAFFSDGSMWAAGGFYRPDPANPGKYIRISQDEFNGESSAK
jgi:hypothetical protein